MSRSVTIPMSRPSDPHTGNTPTSRSRIRRAASTTISASATHCTLGVMMSRAVMTIEVLSLPAGAVANTDQYPQLGPLTQFGQFRLLGWTGGDSGAMTCPVSAVRTRFSKPRRLQMRVGARWRADYRFLARPVRVMPEVGSAHSR